MAALCYLDLKQIKYTVVSLNVIGEIHSPLLQITDCPLQENEGAPPVWIHISESYRQALIGLKNGDTILLFTWLHKSNRDVLMTKPRNDANAPTLGIFATRSPDRPNPIGLHITKILEIADSGIIKVANLEVIDGTPLIDIKPWIG